MDSLHGVTFAEPTQDEILGLERRTGQPQDAVHFYFVLVSNVIDLKKKQTPRMIARRLYVGARSLMVETSA